MFLPTPYFHFESNCITYLRVFIGIKIKNSKFQNSVYIFMSILTVAKIQRLKLCILIPKFCILLKKFSACTKDGVLSTGRKFLKQKIQNCGIQNTKQKPLSFWLKLKTRRDINLYMCKIRKMESHLKPFN